MSLEVRTLVSIYTPNKFVSGLPNGPITKLIELILIKWGVVKENIQYWFKFHALIIMIIFIKINKILKKLKDWENFSCRTIRVLFLKWYSPKNKPRVLI